jgi:hypothetical protein
MLFDSMSLQKQVISNENEMPDEFVPLLQVT